MIENVVLKVFLLAIQILKKSKSSQTTLNFFSKLNATLHTEPLIRLTCSNDPLTQISNPLPDPGRKG